MLERLKRAARALLEAEPEPATVQGFAWDSWPDPMRPDHRVFECPLPGGAYFLVMEVSAPEPGTGHWGWLLMNATCDPVEMRNGFADEERAQAHAIEHYRQNYSDTHS
jgi:hypothetical protein